MGVCLSQIGQRGQDRLRSLDLNMHVGSFFPSPGFQNLQPKTNPSPDFDPTYPSYEGLERAYETSGNSKAGTAAVFPAPLRSLRRVWK